MGVQHFDTDFFYWEATDPPFREARAVPERLRIMRPLLDQSAWVLSGALAGWGDEFIARFELVVFLTLPADVRMERLRAREHARYGAEIEPGGRQHTHHIAFIEWAAGYDRPGFTGRSLEGQRAWLSRLSCPVLALESLNSVEHLTEAVLEMARGDAAGV
jgi:hypothetical protein